MWYFLFKLRDLVVGTVLPIHSRFQWMDYLHGYLESAAALIIPKPEPFNSNIGAIVKPFQPRVNKEIY